MHQQMDTILQRLRQDPARFLDRESIEQACREVGHRWRRCALTPGEILHWFLIQITLGNTAVEHVAAGGTGEHVWVPLVVLDQCLPPLGCRGASGVEIPGQPVNRRRSVSS